MANWQLYVFAFLTGITVAGLTASLSELIYHRPASFWQLIKSSRRSGTMWIFVTAAGPYMLLNDVIEACRGGHIGKVSIAAGVATAVLWASVSGIVVVDLGWRFFRNAH